MEGTLEIIEVKMGDFQISAAPVCLTTGGIGSCVAICLYNYLQRKGALAHVMLPASPGSASPQNDYRYADAAINGMLSALEREGISRHQVIAKIVGGANMFPDIQGRSPKVGERNIESVRAILKDFGLTVSSEETGGSAGRAISFDLSNGIVTIKMTI